MEWLIIGFALIFAFIAWAPEGVTQAYNVATPRGGKPLGVTSHQSFWRTIMSAKDSTLTQDRLKELLYYDHETGIFVWIAKSHPRASRIRIGAVAGSSHGDGYTQINIDSRNHYAHRLAWLYVHGPIPRGMDIDHRDGKRSRNAIINLRTGTRKQNIQNQRKPQKGTTTGYLGVHLRKDTGKFAAYIMESRKRRCLGCFDTAEAASMAYLQAKRELHPFCTI